MTASLSANMTRRRPAHGFSHRTHWPLDASAWSRQVDQARRAGAIDLTISNPTEVGFRYEPSWFQLEAPSHYCPNPLGALPARAAVCDYYARRGRHVDPEQVWLCASTSEAYHRLFTLLGDPGDRIASPRPGYPLLAHLADLADIRLVPYDVLYTDAWTLDRMPDDVRAVVVIAPNNPTGHVLHPATLAPVPDHVPWIWDEVFADYGWHADVPRQRPTERPTLTLNGLSKIAGLPQHKLSWVVIDGPSDWVDQALARAEVIGDAFLSTGSAVEHALPRLLGRADAIQDQIRERLRTNLQALDALVPPTPISRLHADGGWMVLLRLPILEPLTNDLDWASRFLTDGVITQPGFLFDLDRPVVIGLSLLTPPSQWQAGLECIVRSVEAVVRGPR